MRERDRPAGFLTDSQADAIVGQLFHWLYDEPMTNPARQAMQLSTIACIVCDATHADITCQPLHDAYRRAKTAREIDIPAHVIITHGLHDSQKGGAK